MTKDFLTDNIGLIVFTIMFMVITAPILSIFGLFMISEYYPKWKSEPPGDYKVKYYQELLVGIFCFVFGLITTLVLQFSGIYDTKIF